MYEMEDGLLYFFDIHESQLMFVYNHILCVDVKMGLIQNRNSNPSSKYHSWVTMLSK